MTHRLTLLTLTLLSLPVAADDALNARIAQLCATDTLEVRHNVAIEPVVAMGQHRDGQLQIRQDGSALASELARRTQAIDLGSDCLEMLKQAGIAKDAPLARIYFDFDRSDLTSASRAILGELAQRIDAQPLAVTGHTDSTGTESYNQQLGLARAEHAADALSQLGMERDKLTTDSQGESVPLKDNDTREGRAANRRVEIHKL